MTSAEAVRSVLADTTSTAVNINHSEPPFSLSSALPPLVPSIMSAAAALFASPGKTRRAQWDKSRLSITRPVFVGSDDENESTGGGKESQSKPHHVKASQTLSSLSAVLASPTKRPPLPPSFCEQTEQPRSLPPPVIPPSAPALSPASAEVPAVVSSSIPVPSAAARLRRQSSSLNSTYSYSHPHTRSSSPAPSVHAASSATPPLVPRVFRSRESISAAAIPSTSSSPSTSASNAAALLGAAAELVRNSKRAASSKSESQHKRRKSEDQPAEDKATAATSDEAALPTRRLSGRVSLSPSPALRSARQSMSVSSASAFVRANPPRSIKPATSTPAAATVPTPASSAASTAAAAAPPFRVEMVEARQEVERLKLQLQASSGQLSEVTAQQATLRSALHQQTEAVELLRSVLSTERRRVREVEDESEARQRRVDGLEVDVARLMEQVAALRGELKEGEAIRRKLHAFVEEAKGNIRVLVRVRPSLPHEAAASTGGGGDVFGYTSDGGVEMLEVRGKEERSVDGSCLTRKRQSFVFDHVLPPSTPQCAVFDAVQPLLTSVLDGFSVLVFAYGQTSAGKTFTMDGPSTSTPRRGAAAGGDRGPGHARSATTFTAASDAGYEQRGLIQRSVEELFAQASSRQTKRGWTYTTSVSILEVYPRGDAECIRDLLALPNDDLPHELKQTVRPASSLPTTGSTHHSRLDVMVTNLSSHAAASPLDVYPLLDRARQSRSVGSTECNERSSRSHLVVRLVVAGVGGEGGCERSEGVLHLVDLAGSERVKVSKAEGARLKESVGINRSLSSLADVVCAWSKESPHIPYRNSKLTHMLQPFLGGDAKVMMLVCLAGQEEHLSESVQSLRFAQTVSGCGGKRKG